MKGDLTRIAFVDDHPVLLEGVTAVFRRAGGFDVVATGTTAADAETIAVSYQPDVLFIDLSMPGDAFAVITAIARSLPTKVVVFTAFSSVDSAMRALDAGATGFVLKGATCAELLEAVAAVLNGEMFITRQYAGQVLSGLRNRAQREAVGNGVRLNVREKQIVTQLLQARTNREIASSLAISEKTVKRYMTNLMLKLHARNRVEVAVQAQRHADLSQNSSPSP